MAKTKKGKDRKDKGGSSHKGGQLNTWKEETMQWILDEHQKDMDTLPEDQWRSDRLVLNGPVDPTGPHQTGPRADYEWTTDFMVYSSVL